jgi:hypothetical protein
MVVLYIASCTYVLNGSEGAEMTAEARATHHTVPTVARAGVLRNVVVVHVADLHAQVERELY